MISSYFTKSVQNLAFLDKTFDQFSGMSSNRSFTPFKSAFKLFLMPNLNVLANITPVFKTLQNTSFEVIFGYWKEHLIEERFLISLIV